MTRREWIAGGLVAALALVPAAAFAEQHVYRLVYLKTGPKSGQLPEAENKTAFEGHFSNMEKLSGERKLLVAGPFGKERHDEGLRGIFIFATGDAAEAKAWADTDPPTQLGIFVHDHHRVATDYDFKAALERHYALGDRAAKEGRELKFEETMRHYVWLIADDRAKAREALAPLVAKGEVFLVADYDDKQTLALLDADTAANARSKFAGALDKVGKHSLDEWFGSSQLATRP